MSFRWISKKDQPELRTQRPRTGRWVKPFKLKLRDAFILHRRGPRREVVGESALEMRAVPHTQVRGSLEERIVYKELLKRGIPFSFQSSADGGRLQLGGMVADFVLQDRPLVIRVQSIMWHTSIGSEARDLGQKMVIEGYGYVVVDIWDWQIHNDDLREEWFERNIDVPVPTRRAG